MIRQNKPGSILVIQTAFLGDIVLTLPLLRLLKKYKSNRQILLLTTPTGRALLGNRQVADKIIVYDKKGAERGFRHFLQKIREIKNYNVDMVISPHRSVRSGIIALFSGASKRIGYSLPHLFLFYNIRVKRNKKLHEIDRILLLLAPLGIKPLQDERYPVLEVKNTIRREKTVGIAPGSVWGTKRWTEQGYAELIKLLHEHGFSIVLIGSNNDRETADKIKLISDVEVTDMVGKTDLNELAELISGLSIIVTNDNGAMQIAHAVNTPIVAIFGPTVPAQGFAPIRRNSMVIENKELYCRPCSAHGPMQCRKGHFLCMKSISPDAVFRALEQLASRAGKTNPENAFAKKII